VASTGLVRSLRLAFKEDSETLAHVGPMVKPRESVLETIDLSPAPHSCFPFVTERRGLAGRSRPPLAFASKRQKPQKPILRCGKSKEFDRVEISDSTSNPLRRVKEHLPLGRVRVSQDSEARTVDNEIAARENRRRRCAEGEVLVGVYLDTVSLIGTFLISRSSNRLILIAFHSSQF